MNSTLMSFDLLLKQVDEARNRALTLEKEIGEYMEVCLAMNDEAVAIMKYVNVLEKLLGTGEQEVIEKVKPKKVPTAKKVTKPQGTLKNRILLLLAESDEELNAQEIATRLDMMTKQQRTTVASTLKMLTDSGELKRDKPAGRWVYSLPEEPLPVRIPVMEKTELKLSAQGIAPNGKEKELLKENLALTTQGGEQG